MHQSGLASRASVLALAVLLVIGSLQTRPAEAGASEWVDIKVVDGNLMLSTEIAGIPGFSIIDTGAQFNAINESFLRASDLTYDKGRFLEVQGVFSTQRRYTYSSIPVTVFGNEINFRDVVELDLRSSDVQMILGESFLEGYIFQFDYPNQRMRLITRDSVDLKKIRNIKTSKPSYGGPPLVRVSLSDKIDAWLSMDTGSTGGILIDRDLASRLDWLDTYDTTQMETTGVISSGTLEYFTVPSIGFGPVKIADVLVAVPARGEDLGLFQKYTPLGTRIPVGGKSKGLLGYDILQHFVVTIDYEKGYVHVYPGEKSVTEE
jgi:hypothetical protein